MKMDGETKPRSFMIADLLTNVSPSKPNSPLPIEVHSSDNATGSDVTVNRDVIDGSVQSPTTITSRGTIQDNLCVEPRPNHRLKFAAGTFSSVAKPVPIPAGLLQHRISSCEVFQDAERADDGMVVDSASAAAVAHLSLEASGRYVTPFHWQNVVYTAGNKCLQASVGQLLH